MRRKPTKKQKGPIKARTQTHSERKFLLILRQPTKWVRAIKGKQRDEARKNRKWIFNEKRVPSLFSSLLFSLVLFIHLFMFAFFSRSLPPLGSRRYFHIVFFLFAAPSSSWASSSSLSFCCAVVCIAHERVSCVCLILVLNINR